MATDLIRQPVNFYLSALHKSSPGSCSQTVTVGQVFHNSEGSYEYLNIETRATGETEKRIILYFQVYRSACLILKYKSSPDISSGLQKPSI